MSEKHKNVCTGLNHIEHLLFSVCMLLEVFQFLLFASLVCIPVDISNSIVGLYFCAITAGIKKYNSLIKKKKRKHDKLVFSARTKLNGTEVLVFRVLVDWYISHNEFAFVNNVSKKYDDMQETIKNLKASTVY